MSDELTPEQQWAYIFNTLGEERVRGMLGYIAASLEDDSDRKVIEVRSGDEDVQVMDITDHVDVLEDGIETQPTSGAKMQL